jgi:hypothetical protein
VTFTWNPQAFQVCQIDIKGSNRVPEVMRNAMKRYSEVIGAKASFFPFDLEKYDISLIESGTRDFTVTVPVGKAEDQQFVTSGTMVVTLLMTIVLLFTMIFQKRNKQD